MKNASFFLLLVLSFGSVNTVWAQSPSWDTAVTTAIDHIKRFGRPDGQGAYTFFLPHGGKVHLQGSDSTQVLTIFKKDHLDVMIWMTETKNYKANVYNGVFFGLLPVAEVATIVKKTEQFLQELPTVWQKKKGGIRR